MSPISSEWLQSESPSRFSFKHSTYDVVDGVEGHWSLETKIGPVPRVMFSYGLPPDDVDVLLADTKEFGGIQSDIIENGKIMVYY